MLSIFFEQQKRMILLKPTQHIVIRHKTDTKRGGNRPATASRKTNKKPAETVKNRTQIAAQNRKTSTSREKTPPAPKQNRHASKQHPGSSKNSKQQQQNYLKQQSPGCFQLNNDLHEFSLSDDQPTHHSSFCGWPQKVHQDVRVSQA
jgi:hypothetical protein